MILRIKFLPGNLFALCTVKLVKMDITSVFIVNVLGTKFKTAEVVVVVTTSECISIAIYHTIMVSAFDTNNLSLNNQPSIT